MLSSRLNAFVIPTSQKRAIATPSTSFSTSSTRRPAAIAMAAAPNCAASFASGLRWRMSSTSPATKTSAVAGEDPGELPGRFERADGERQEDAGGDSGRDGDPAEGRRRMVVPALAGGLGHEPRGDSRSAKQGPQGERRDWECGDRDDRVHAARRVAADPARLLRVTPCAWWPCLIPGRASVGTA